MGFDLTPRGQEAARSFDLAVRTVLAQWEIDSAASWHWWQMLQTARAKELQNAFANLRLDWRRPFEPGNRDRR